ncbi:TonB family protein [Hymenobacter sp. H14-R3]|uniref:energy transducer TonB n=1 Tax=Hymenobacter sp. H14-R3 TaxID=3046308 RepID=UPI0024BB7ECD|nr:energy transducer TonB [Hymenobacter sp. H14-R3]MDJ0364023.1 TonB family protein [Hymenobacter sp. H14-R3]
MRFSLFLLALAAPLATLAQTRPAPAAKAPIVLAPGNMKLQAGGGADNRPDHAPEFPGGEEAMGEFFTQNVKIPVKAKQARVTGDVLVTATVGTDGKLTNPIIAKGLTPECNAEALRVVQALPAWQPATRRGVPVPIMVQVPVPFDNAGVVKFENDRKVPRSAKDAPGLN